MEPRRRIDTARLSQLVQLTQVAGHHTLKIETFGVPIGVPSKSRSAYLAQDLRGRTQGLLSVVCLE